MMVDDFTLVEIEEQLFDAVFLAGHWYELAASLGLIEGDGRAERERLAREAVRRLKVRAKV